MIQITRKSQLRQIIQKAFDLYDQTSLVPSELSKYKLERITEYIWDNGGAK